MDDPELCSLLQDLAETDADSATVDQKLQFCKRLLRGVRYEDLVDMCRGDTNYTAMTGADLAKAELFYTKAKRLEKLDGFVSYHWGADAQKRGQQLEDILGNRYGLEGMRRPRVAEEGQNAMLWLDRFSSPQSGPLFEQARRYKFFFMEYLAFSEQAFVIASPQYFKRLWCLFEYVSFIALRDMTNMYVGVTAFLQDDPTAAWEGYAESIRNISVDAADCTHDEDRVILRGLIEDNFVSVEELNGFLKYAAVALLGRSLLQNMSYERGQNVSDHFREGKVIFIRWGQSAPIPIEELARELGFDALAEALLTLAKEISEIEVGTIDISLRQKESYARFNELILPELLAKQQKVLRPDAPLIDLSAAVRNLASETPAP
eukprot:TRINITY_DN72528_c0_g1_i1.p1 TRINITY_DN72528_c0_g1~~TRINITY_DN72528_c0_g1_i1.p1  ORF type:complete len:376 (-),score=69.66 TRINITY_DN72528_c0_g1_i1:160-1287(-)